MTLLDETGTDETPERFLTARDMGRLFGSTRFMAPEEFELGVMIDQSTTVFTLGRCRRLLRRVGWRDHAFLARDARESVQ
jgi:hypothetical protein